MCVLWHNVLRLKKSFINIVVQFVFLRCKEYSAHCLFMDYDCLQSAVLSLD